jgi:hypothetical protein
MENDWQPTLEQVDQTRTRYTQFELNYARIDLLQGKLNKQEDYAISNNNKSK